MTGIDKAFEKYTTVASDSSGVTVACTKGLWRVSAPTKDQAVKEAKHYFVQYFGDGEYFK